MEKILKEFFTEEMAEKLLDEYNKGGFPFISEYLHKIDDKYKNELKDDFKDYYGRYSFMGVDMKNNDFVTKLITSAEEFPHWSLPQHLTKEIMSRMNLNKVSFMPK